jgi:hypothetical protein
MDFPEARASRKAFFFSGSIIFRFPPFFDSRNPNLELLEPGEPAVIER